MKMPDEHLRRITEKNLYLYGYENLEGIKLVIKERKNLN